MRFRPTDYWLSPRCELCLQPGVSTLLCDDCEADLPWLGHHCECCALPLAEQRTRCGRCLAKPPPWHSVLAPFSYQFPADRWIKALKFNHQLHHSRIMAHYLGHTIRATLEPQSQLLIPVPLHPARLKERGFNQSQQLCRHISKQLGLPVAYGMARRIRHTAPQSGLNRRQRLVNLRRAFAIHDPKQLLRNTHVVLIDDVMTTGTTVRMLSRALLEAGAARVDIAVLARAI